MEKELKEEWRKIPSHPDYLVSNMGRVKSLERPIRYTHAVTGQELFRTTKERYLKVYFNDNTGYKFHQLYKDKKVSNKTVHALVAETFLIKGPDDDCVNHKDGNKHNNRVDNLEWCTNKYNHVHAVMTGLKASGSRIGSAILTERCVIAIKNMSAKGFTNQFISEIFEIKRATVRYCVKYWNAAQGPIDLLKQN